MARIALALAPLALLLTNACTVTIHGEGPASPEDVAWTPPPRVVVAEPAPAPVVYAEPAPAPVVVRPAPVAVRAAPPAVRDDGRRVLVQRAPAPRPVYRTDTPVDSALAAERLLALRAARQEATDRRALAQSDVRALEAERERNRQAQQLERTGARPAAR